MRDDPVGREFGDRPVGIAEIDRDHRNPGGAGGVDVGDGIADHDRVVEPAAGLGDRLDQRRRIGLGDPEGVLAADEAESAGDAERAQQQMRGALELVGADREPEPRRRGAVERRLDAGKQMALVGDMGVVMNEKLLEQALQPVGRERRPAWAKPRAISARAPAPSRLRACATGKAPILRAPGSR